MLGALKRGGKYSSSGVIGGPLVTLDMRTFYLKDLTLIGNFVLIPPPVDA